MMLRTWMGLFLLFLPATAWAVEVEIPATTHAQCLCIPAPDGFVPEAGAHYVLRSPQGEKIPVVWVPSFTVDGQVANAAGRMQGVFPADKTGASYTLEKGTGNVSSQAVQTMDDGKTTLTISDQDGKIWAYNYGERTRDVDDYRNHRSCYVHPIWDLDGEVLTEDFPDDHYHHHGLFWAWEGIFIDGQRYDLWLGTNIHQQFERFLRKPTAVDTVLGVENTWRVEGRAVMTERVWLQAFPVEGDGRCVDVDIFCTPTDRPITLRGAANKSYGGLAIRFSPGPWNAPRILTSRGETKEDLVVTQLAWIDFNRAVAKETPEKKTGVSIFIPPTHPGDATRGWPPTWVVRFYGAQFIGWPGVDGKTFAAGETFHLHYRLRIHRDAPSFETLQKVYEEYSQNRVEWEKTSLETPKQEK